MSRPHITIFGRFPPPFDGQSLSTQRLAQLLDSDFEIRKISASAPVDASNLQKVIHYVNAGMLLREALSASETRCIIWTSISPQKSGHLRDRLTVVPLLKGHLIIAVVHWGSFAQLFLQRFTSRSARKMVDRIDHFVFTDQLLSDACGNWIPSWKRTVIVNTVDDGILCSEEDVASRPVRKRDAPLRILFLSNMIREKGYLDVVQAAGFLHEKGLPIRLEFVGQWYSEAEEKEFLAVVASNNLDAVTTHHGLVEDRSVLKRHYLGADVLAFPTYLEEAQPLCIIEALSAGLPVITTREGAIPNMIRDGEEGFFVEARNPESLAAALEKVADRPLLNTLSLRARTRFLETFHPNTVRRGWIDLVDRLTSNRRDPQRENGS